MKPRTTVIAMLSLVAMCGAALYAMQNYFSRDAQMRNAELSFRSNHAEEIAANKAAMKEAAESAAYSAPEVEQPVPEEEEPLTLDDWYADAGSASEPFDPTPEDNSYLINSAEPFE